MSLVLLNLRKLEGTFRLETCIYERLKKCKKVKQIKTHEKGLSKEIASELQKIKM